MHKQTENNRKSTNMLSYHCCLLPCILLIVMLYICISVHHFKMTSTLPGMGHTLITIALETWQQEDSYPQATARDPSSTNKQKKPFQKEEK